MIFLFDFTLFVIDIHHIMLISLFPTPFDHFHFHPTLGLDPALILTLRLKTIVMTRKGESGRVEKINTISEDIEDSDFHRTKDIVANIP